MTTKLQFLLRIRKYISVCHKYNAAIVQQIIKAFNFIISIFKQKYFHNDSIHCKQLNAIIKDWRVTTCCNLIDPIIQITISM